jgi:serine phosphatase RsbU (regulator of sigma subunit)
MIFRIFLFFISLCALHLPLASAQEVNADSLLAVAVEAKRNNDLPTALRTYIQAMKTFEKQQLTKPELANKQLAPIYVEIGKIYEQSSLYENALDYFRKSNNLSENANTNELIANGLLESKKYKEALGAYNKALKIYKAEHNHSAIVRNLQQIVNCYKKLGQYDEALESNMEILNLARGSKDKKEELIALNNIGYIYRYLQNYTKSLDFLNQTLILQRQLKTNYREEIVTLINIGVVNQNLGNYSDALASLSEALQIAQKQKNQTEVVKIQNLIAVVYLNSKDIYNAETYNESSVVAAERLKNPVLLQSVYETKSKILQAKEDFQQALDFYKKYATIRDSIELAERISQQELLQQQFLAERDEKKVINNISEEEERKAALLQLKAEMRNQQLVSQSRIAEAKAIKAELANQKLATEIAKRELKIVQQQSEAERKNRMLAELERTRIAQDLALEKSKAAEKETQIKLDKAEQDKKIQELEAQQQELETQKRAEETKFLYIIVGFTLFSTFLTVWGLANTRRKNKLLAQQKQEIEVKHSELEQTQEELKMQRDTLAIKSAELDHAYTNITASITYAKRIQDAILPPINLIQQSLPHSFVLYKPRDIVSGDFYWFAPISQQHSVITAVDCTGHGVPGAFMSMIGDSLLNQIIMEKGIISPDLILHELDKGVRQALRKGEHDAKDGMDMSLCLIDKHLKIMEFAGAMNPICYVQNGELTEIKADKRAIGGEGTDEFLFTKHTIDISIPTTIYLYTDGFQDQFGGVEGRKFMTKRFRELLLEIHPKPLAEQRQILDYTIEEWKGRKHKQIDDILVIGLKV